MDEENLYEWSEAALAEAEKMFVKRLKKEKMMRQNMNFKGFLEYRLYR